MRSCRSLELGPAALIPWRTSSVQSAAWSPPVAGESAGELSDRAVAAVDARQLAQGQFRGSLPARRNSAARGHFPASRARAKAASPRGERGASRVDFARHSDGGRNHQELNIITTLPQWGQIDRYDVEPVIEVFAEPVGLDFFQEVAISRGDDPRVDLLGVVIADPLKLSLLQDPKQLDLELGRGAVDLVEEDAAGVGCFKAAGAVINGTGE